MMHQNKLKAEPWVQDCKVVSLSYPVSEIMAGLYNN